MHRKRYVVALAAVLSATTSCQTTSPDGPRKQPASLHCPSIIPPDSAQASEPNASPSNGRYRVGDRIPNATALLYVDGHLQRDFGLRAFFTQPRVPGNKGLFYTNWIILIPSNPGPQPFFQITLLRWKKFDYRLELAPTWALPGEKLTFADTKLFPAEGPHQLGITVKGDLMRLEADGREICRASRREFFSDDRLKSLYFQIGTEAVAVGDRAQGRVERIEVKTDDDLKYRPAVISCAYRDRGLEWVQSGRGFDASGALEPTKPQKFFGFGPDKKCRFQGRVY